MNFSGILCPGFVAVLRYFTMPWKMFFVVVAEHIVVIKQEKIDEPSVVPQTERKLFICFCPEGYSTATKGHYHCRHCGLSCCFMQNIIRHEAIHTDSPAGGTGPSQQCFSCRYCGLWSRFATDIERHEKLVHSKSRRSTERQELESQSATAGVGTSISMETADRKRVSGERRVSFAVSW